MTVEVLKTATEELSFRPTDAQIRAKSQFWQRFSENPICDASQIDLPSVLQLVNDSRMNRWWSMSGFQAWFCNQGEWRELMETTAYKALQKLDEIISMPSEGKIVGAQVNAIKLLFEAGRKMPPRQAPKQEYLDGKVAGMSSIQLKEFLHKNRAILLPLLQDTEEPK